MRAWFVILISLLALSARAVDLSDGEIHAARKIYIGKCAKCHKLHDPRNYSEVEWSKWMRKMTRKSRLSAHDSTLLSEYLDNLRDAEKTGGRP